MGIQPISIFGKIVGNVQGHIFFERRITETVC